MTERQVWLFCILFAVGSVAYVVGAVWQIVNHP